MKHNNVPSGTIKSTGCPPKTSGASPMANSAATRPSSSGGLRPVGCKEATWARASRSRSPRMRSGVLNAHSSSAGAAANATCKLKSLFSATGGAAKAGEAFGWAGPRASAGLCPNGCVGGAGAFHGRLRRWRPTVDARLTS